MTTDQGKRKVGRILTNKQVGSEPLPEIPNVNYAEILMKEFNEFENKIAVVDGHTGKNYTFKTLRQMAYQLKAGFLASGIKHGDAVILISKNNIDIPVVYLGTMLVGAACVPLNSAMTKEELVHAVHISKAKWVVANAVSMEKIESAFKSCKGATLEQAWTIEDKSQVKSPENSIYDLIRGNTADYSMTNKDFDASKTVALLPFSSGTTGLPKGVMLTHRNLLTMYTWIKYTQVLMELKHLDTVYECALAFLPMYHMYGFGMLNFMLMKGGKLVILSKFSPREFFEVIQNHRVTFLPVVPHIMKFMVDSPMMTQYDLSSVMVFLVGSSPVTQQTMDDIMKKTDRMVAHGYSMTETCGVGFSKVGPQGFKPHSVGTVGAYLEAKIIDPETGEILPEYEEGEVCFKGPSIMLGYANNLKATAATIDYEGWLHSGDMAYYDEDDFLYITDRIKDLIKVKSFQVSPSEIENILNALEEIKEVAVVGVPHDKLGEAPRAWVVPMEGATLDLNKLAQLVADQVSEYKQLAGGIEIIDSLPRNHLGKVMKRSLKMSYIDKNNTRSKL